MGCTSISLPPALLLSAQLFPSQLFLTHHHTLAVKQLLSYFAAINLRHSFREELQLDNHEPFLSQAKLSFVRFHHYSRRICKTSEPQQSNGWLSIRQHNIVNGESLFRFIYHFPSCSSATAVCNFGGRRAVEAIISRPRPTLPLPCCSPIQFPLSHTHSCLVFPFFCCC